MPHETELIALLAVGFGPAFMLGFVAFRLQLPPLVGDLVAGIAVARSHPGSSPMATSPPSSPRSA